MMRIAQVTDLHVQDMLEEAHKADGRRNVLAVFERVKSRGIRDVVLSGDLGIPESHSWLFGTAADFGFSIRVIPGNHDDPVELRKFAFLDRLFKGDGLYYAESHGGTDILFLDSGTGEIGRDQLAWIRAELAASGGPLAVFVHYPILDCGGTVMDRLYPLKNRDAVRELLIAAGRKTTIFCGHYHNRYETIDGDLKQFVTPSALIQIKPYGEKPELESTRIAYREIAIGPDRMETELIDI